MHVVKKHSAPNNRKPLHSTIETATS